MPAHKTQIGPCVVDGCEAPARSRGWCKHHYERWRKRGYVDDRIGDRRRTRSQKFFDKVKKADCWLWQGSRNNQGYGQFWNGTRLVLAHRWAYEALVGPIPTGLVLDHIVCETRACVRPDHVVVTSVAENSGRGRRDMTHCKRGHEYNEENTLVTSQGHRFCRPCKRLRELGSAD